jgi:hypothetical protein
MAHYAIVNAATGEIVRVVQIFPARLPPELYCLPLSDACGSADPLPAPRGPPARLATDDRGRVSHRALSGAAMRSSVRRALAAARDGPPAALLVFHAERSGVGASEPGVRAALYVLATAVGTDDRVGRLADDTIGVLLPGISAQSARDICARVEHRMARLAAVWSARYLSCSEDREEIEALCQDSA